MLTSGYEKSMPFMIKVSNKKFDQIFAFFQVLSGITNPELDILDAFEDVEYDRRAVEVSLMVGIIEILLIAFYAPFTDYKTCISEDLKWYVDVTNKLTSIPSNTTRF